MEYKGKLYGKAGEVVFPLLHTTDDWEAMEKKIAELEAQCESQKSAIPIVRISLPSDAEIHSMADEVSLRQDTRDRMIHTMGLEQGATWIRNNIREQLGSES